eukprot:snap_masked-scaffold_59-processed-gene-0.82-mRNA-1 protein AED:1.00 eAED:1.00 QI:0/0/0/0/1/1/2/0/60
MYTNVKLLYYCYSAQVVPKHKTKKAHWRGGTTVTFKMYLENWYIETGDEQNDVTCWKLVS